MADAETVGKYLIDTIDTIDTRRLIYKNDLFECLALDYAFRNGVEEKAKTVISIGYDRYLSIEEMFIIRKYSKKLFLEEMDKLKVICLHHLTIDRKSYMDRYYRDLYGNVFCDELTNISRICISKIDPNNRSDPRNRIKTAVPEWL